MGNVMSKIYFEKIISEYTDLDKGGIRRGVKAESYNRSVVFTYMK